MPHDALHRVALDVASVAHEHLFVPVHACGRVTLPMEGARIGAPPSISLVYGVFSTVVDEDGADLKDRPHLLLFVPATGPHGLPCPPELASHGLVVKLGGEAEEGSDLTLAPPHLRVVVVTDLVLNLTEDVIQDADLLVGQGLHATPPW